MDVEFPRTALFDRRDPYLVESRQRSTHGEVPARRGADGADDRTQHPQVASRKAGATHALEIRGVGRGSQRSDDGLREAQRHPRGFVSQLLQLHPVCLDRLFDEALAEALLGVV